MRLHQIRDLGRITAICPCGHSAPLDARRIQSEHNNPTVRQIRRAMRCEWCGHRSKPWLAVTMNRRGQEAWTAFMRAPSAKPQREASEKKLLNMLAGILDPTARALVQREMEEQRAAREGGT